MKNFSKNLDYILTPCIILICIYSLIITYSASNKDVYMLIKKIIHILLSFIIMIKITNSKYKDIKNNIYFYYLLCITSLLLIKICGYKINGAKRWINIIGIISFQPSEILKFIMPILISKIISKNYPLTEKHILLIMTLIFIPSYLIYSQPDLGTSLLIISSSFLTLYLGEIKNKIIIYFIITSILSIPITWKFLLHEYQKKRITTLINYNSDIRNKGYHIYQSKIAIGSGGKYGKGIFKGTQNKLNFIPEKTTDFIFTVIAEENGFTGICLLILLYITIIIRCLYISINKKNIFKKLVTCSFSINLFIYIIINIGMVVGLLPVVGVPLPFISYGGSSLITTMSMIGYIMSINKKKKYFKK